MVICTYFLNNMCRFGAKCNNEHVNVKLTLKTDAETTLMGKQWPLSSYGPFRDKPSIPNFVEDQSFEEARFQCYDAKATGNVQAIAHQFTQKATDARNKMTMLMNPTDDVVTLVTNLYNNTSSTASNANNTNANAFGMNANSNSNSNTNSMSAGSIFGGSNTQAGNTNLFGASGGSALNPNPFARNATGFGAQAQTQTQTPSSNNLFGNSAQNQNSMFGGSNTGQTAGSIFGGSSFANPQSNANTGSSLFTASSQPKSLFASSAASGPFSQPNTNPNPFGAPQMGAPTANQPSSIFGSQMQNQNPTFGGGPTFGNQKTGLFAQANATLGQQPNSGSIFGQSTQSQGFASMNGNTPQQPGGLFGNTAQNQSQSIFGGQAQIQNSSMQSQNNPFATAVQPAQNGIFGNTQQQQTQQQQQQQQPPPLFQNASNAFGNPNTANQNSQSIFGNSQASAFNQQLPAAAVAPIAAIAPTQQPQQQNVFANSPFANGNQSSGPTSGTNLFQQAQPQTQTAQSVFGQPLPPPNPFLATEQPPSATLYTPMGELTPEEIEAFNSDRFTDLSLIPTKPPPMELCR